MEIEITNQHSNICERYNKEYNTNSFILNYISNLNSSSSNIQYYIQEYIKSYYENEIAKTEIAKIYCPEEFKNNPYLIYSYDFLKQSINFEETK